MTRQKPSIMRLPTRLALAAAFAVPTLPALTAAAQDAQPDGQVTTVIKRDKPSTFAQPALEGYDFQAVFKRVDGSTVSLRREMDASFKVFQDAIAEAEKLIDEGKTQEAVEKCVVAINGVLQVRDDVLDPMWDAQGYLQEQVAFVRNRLGQALEADPQPSRTGEPREDQLDRQNEAVLDVLALKIRDEKDPTRRKKLVMQYQTLREIGKVRQIAKRLSPDQRRVWASVLKVLDNVSLSHQQVILNTELLFVQFEATAQRLDDNLTLMETMKGARELLGLVNNAGASEGALAQFATDMTNLQQQLDAFNRQTESIVLDENGDLNTALQDVEEKINGPQSALEDPIDDELARRLDRLENPE
ncbi:MAG: hypothetical protein AAGI68_07135 [Planctomycetota bacterium]